jgi:hypothetical protein
MDEDSDAAVLMTDDVTLKTLLQNSRGKNVNNMAVGYGLWDPSRKVFTALSIPLP